MVIEVDKFRCSAQEGTFDRFLDESSILVFASADATAWTLSIIHFYVLDSQKQSHKYGYMYASAESSRGWRLAYSLT